MTLPPGWAVAEFGEVVRIESDLVDPATAPEAPHIAPNHIESGTGRLLDYTTVQNDGVTSAKHRFHAGQVLYSKIRPYLAKAVLVDFDGLCSADMYPLSPETSVLDARFLHRWLLSETFTSRVCQDQGRTVLPKVNQAALSKIPVPLPPLAEQKRIVAKLEELTARSRRAKEALDAVPPLLDQLRQSILAAAFRGDLTADWRERNPDVEPADELLARASKERRRQWVAGEQAKFAAKGRQPTDAAWESKYVDPPSLDQSDFPPIPASWRWTPLDAVRAGDAPMVYGIILPGDDVPGGVAYVRPVDIAADGAIDIGRLKRTSSEIASDYRRSSLLSGDIIMSIVGTIGKIAVASSALDGANITQSSIRIRPGTATTTDFLKWALQAPCLLRQYDQLRFGNAVQRLNVEHVRQLVVPLPPLEEQAQICTRIRAALAHVDQLEIASLSSRLEALGASVLARAFSGKLVPQDRKDEPATTLMARIRATHDAGGGVGSSPTRRGRPLRPSSEAAKAEPAGLQTQLEITAVHQDVLHDGIFTTLWRLGPLDEDEAVRRVAAHLRGTRHFQFDPLIPNTQLLAAIDSAVAANHLDRPLPNHVRAIKPDPTSYTPDDWQHILLTTLPTTPTDRDTAIRTAAEYARDNLGLAFSRLRSDGRIVQALRSAITTAIRRGEVLRHGPTKISLAPSESASRTRRS